MKNKMEDRGVNTRCIFLSPSLTSSLWSSLLILGVSLVVPTKMKKIPRRTERDLSTIEAIMNECVRLSLSVRPLLLFLSLYLSRYLFICLFMFPWFSFSFNYVFGNCVCSFVSVVCNDLFCL